MIAHDLIVEINTLINSNDAFCYGKDKVLRLLKFCATDEAPLFLVGIVSKHCHA